MTIADQEYTFVVKGWKASLITLAFTVLIALGIVKFVETTLAIGHRFL